MIRLKLKVDKFWLKPDICCYNDVGLKPDAIDLINAKNLNSEHYKGKKTIEISGIKI